MHLLTTGQSEYLYKPAVRKYTDISESFRGIVQECGYDVQKIVDPESAVVCRYVDCDGLRGSVQERIKTLPNGRNYSYVQFYDEDLSTSEVNQFLREFISDHLLCSFDGHGANFVVVENGIIRGVDKEEYLENCIIASKMICIKAKEVDIPLATLKLDLLSDFIDFYKLNILKDYDPVVYRKNNSKLSSLYQSTKDSLTSVEARIISSFNSREDLIRGLRIIPNHKGIKSKYFDCITFFKREELIRVIKKCPDKDIVSFVEKYYSKKRKIIIY